MTPYFSVILPVYNVEKYLARCVRSVLEQDFSDYEMVLVDDGATDGSGRLCDELAETDPRIRVHHKENGGLASARNVGMEMARGQYIWFVDSDDWIEPGALKRLYQATRENSPDVVKFNYIRVEKEQTPVFSNAEPGIYRTEDQHQRLQAWAFYSAGKYVLSACTHIYKTQLIRRHGISFVSERLVGSEDYLFNLQVLVQARCVCVIADPLYYYEQRMGSLTQRYKKNLPQRYERLYALLRESFEREGLLKHYEGKLAAFYLWHLLRGTCIPNEYYAANGHSIPEGRKNIRAFLGSQSARDAYGCCDKKGFSRKKRVQLWAMKMKLEPLFYWLYVIKPRLKKGIVHEDQG